jgi:hypothetical protein
VSIVDIVERNRRAWAGGVAALLIVAAAWLGWNRANEDPVVRDEPVESVVRSVATGGGIATCEVELASGTRVRVACGLPAPKEGESLELRSLHHRSGAVTYFAPRGHGAGL